MTERLGLHQTPMVIVVVVVVVVETRHQWSELVESCPFCLFFFPSSSSTSSSSSRIAGLCAALSVFSWEKKLFFPYILLGKNLLPVHLVQYTARKLNTANLSFSSASSGCLDDDVVAFKGKH